MFIDILITLIIYQSGVMDYLLLQLVDTLFWKNWNRGRPIWFQRLFFSYWSSFSVRISSHNLYHTFSALAISNCTTVAVTTYTLTKIHPFTVGFIILLDGKELKTKSQRTFKIGIQKKISYSAAQVSNTSTAKSLHTLRRVAL